MAASREFFVRNRRCKMAQSKLSSSKGRLSSLADRISQSGTGRFWACMRSLISGSVATRSKPQRQSIRKKAPSPQFISKRGADRLGQGARAFCKRLNCMARTNWRLEPVACFSRFGGVPDNNMIVKTDFTKYACFSFWH